MSVSVPKTVAYLHAVVGAQGVLAASHRLAPNGPPDCIAEGRTPGRGELPELARRFAGEARRIAAVTDHMARVRSSRPGVGSRRLEPGEQLRVTMELRSDGLASVKLERRDTGGRSSPLSDEDREALTQHAMRALAHHYRSDPGGIH